jgi:transcriptional regulator GlxA family with amidase domain
MTLIDYISQHRVNHAQRMLVTSDESILNVAFSSGFHSLSRFNAVFKTYAGCTPRTYRRNHRLPQTTSGFALI